MTYCLLGLFDVNMPLLYGEGGQKAFYRLQTEIIRISDDESLFAWTSKQPGMSALLADHPRYFADSADIMEDSVPSGIHRPPISVTSKGLTVALPENHLKLCGPNKETIRFFLQCSRGYRCKEFFDSKPLYVELAPLVGLRILIRKNCTVLKEYRSEPEGDLYTSLNLQRDLVENTSLHIYSPAPAFSDFGGVFWQKPPVDARDFLGLIEHPRR